MEWFTLIIYILILFDNGFLENYIPYSNYIDELMCFFFVALGIIHICKNNGRIAINKQQKISVLCMSLILLIGIVGNMMFGYMPSTSVILRDIVGTFKFFIIYLIGVRLVQKNNVQINFSKMLLITKITISVIFVFAIMNLFADIGVSDSVRYGLKSYRFIYSHYTFLVYNEVLLYAVLSTADKKNTVFKIMSLLSIAATLRTKGVITIAFILVWYLLNFAKKKNISFKDVFKPIYIIPIGIAVYCISKSKIQEYLSWGVGNSIRIGMHAVGLQIANDHFPFGTGFGTYGTNISYGNQSLLYSLYGSLNYSHLMTYGGAVISDVYWPSIYVQFGYIGMTLFIIMIVQVCKDLINNAVFDNRCKFSALLIMFYMISASISEATFSNASGSYSAVILLMIVLISKNKMRKKDSSRGTECE